MNEIKLLLERAASKLSAAKMLLREGYFDDAVSRAYYSMHFAARALLLTKDIAPKTHKGLILKEDREDADYSITCEITEEEAESVIEDADAFLERIEEAVKEIAKET